MKIGDLIKEYDLNPDESFCLFGGQGFGGSLYTGRLEYFLKNFIPNGFDEIAKEEGLSMEWHDDLGAYVATDPISCFRAVLSKIKATGSYQDKDDWVGHLVRPSESAD